MTHAQLAARAGPGAVTGPPRLCTDNDHDAVPLGCSNGYARSSTCTPPELSMDETSEGQHVWLIMRQIPGCGVRRGPGDGPSRPLRRRVAVLMPAA
jgi:hypothetical protein